MLLECANCGAPLDVKQAGATVKCNYCGRQQQSTALRVQDASTPANWQAPKVWIAPPQFQSVAGRSLTYQPVRAITSAIVMTILPIVIMVVVGGGFAATRFTSRSTFGIPSPLGGGGGWDGKQALRCSGIEKVNASGVNGKGKLETAIQAQNVCEVELSNVTLSADRLIEAEHSGKVVIRGGTIDVGREGIVAKDGAKVELRNVRIRVGAGRSTMDGVTVIDASGAAKVELYDCTIEVLSQGVSGEAYGVKVRDGARVTVNGGKFSGRYTVYARSLGALEAAGADMKAKIDVETPATVKGVESRGGEKAGHDKDDGKDGKEGKDKEHCGCSKGDHACRKRCKASKR